MSEVVARAIALLEQALLSDDDVGLMELAQRAQVDKSTASRLLAFLAERELLVRDPVTRSFRPGPYMTYLATAAMRKSDLRTLSMPKMRYLGDLTGETVGLHLKLGLDRVCIAGVESAHRVRRVLALGDRNPLYRGVSSKAILAFLPVDERAAVLELAMADGVDLTLIEDQVNAVRRRGGIWAIGDRSAAIGAVSVPVFDVTGVTAALTISGPDARCTEARLEEFLAPLLAAAAEISVAVGGEPPLPSAAAAETSASPPVVPAEVP